MTEITSIHLTDEAFDKLRKNMEHGIFVSFSSGISNDVRGIENDNPSVEELQERINALYKRFENFKSNKKKLGIKKIEMKYIKLDMKISALLNRDITDIKSCVEVIKQAEATMLDLEREISFINAIENPVTPTKEQYQNHLKKVLAGLNPELKMKVQQNVEELLRKQIENKQK